MAQANYSVQFPAQSIRRSLPIWLSLETAHSRRSGWDSYINWPIDKSVVIIRAVPPTLAGPVMASPVLADLLICTYQFHTLLHGSFHTCWWLVVNNSCQITKQINCCSSNFQNMTSWKESISDSVVCTGCTIIAQAVFYHICITAVKTRKLKLSMGNVKNSVFFFAGFRNCKDATVAFVNHTHT